MGALDVIGEDLQARLGVGLGRRRQQQVLDGLAGIGLDRARAHDDSAVEDPVAAPADHPLVALAAGAVRRQVLDAGLVVQVLLAAGQVQAVQGHLGAGALERDPHLVARDGPAAGRQVRAEAAVPGLAHVQAGEMEGAAAGVLQAVVLKLCAGLEHDLAQRVAQVDPGADGHMAFDQACMAAGAELDQAARMRRQRRGARIGEEHQVNRPLKRAVGGDLQYGAVLAEGGIERAEGMWRHLQGTRQQGFEGRALCFRQGRQVAQAHARGQPRQRREPRGEMAIDEHQSRAAVVADPLPQAGGGQAPARRRDGRLERHRQDGRDPGVLPGFVLGRGKTVVGQPAPGRVAHLPAPGGLAGRLGGLQARQQGDSAGTVHDPSPGAGGASKWA